MHSEWPKLHGVLAILSAKGLSKIFADKKKKEVENGSVFFFFVFFLLLLVFVFNCVSLSDSIMHVMHLAEQPSQYCDQIKAFHLNFKMA